MRAYGRVLTKILRGFCGAGTRLSESIDHAKVRMSKRRSGGRPAPQGIEDAKVVFFGIFRNRGKFPGGILGG
jgi:hypothetical protein